MKSLNIIQNWIKPLLTILFAFLLLLPLANAQGRKSLEGKRKRLLAEIRTTSNLLNQAARDKTATLERYLTLQRQIQKREELIQTLQEELAFATENINRTGNVVTALTEDIARLEEEYAIMVRNAYRQKVNQSTLLFLFSADGFNQAFRRWQYLKQYDQYRKKQASLIIETNKTLNTKLLQLAERKLEKERLITDQENQNLLLGKELDDKSNMLEVLKSDEDRLRKELNKKQLAHQKLNDAIEKVIRKEMLAARKAARNSQILNQAPSKKNSTSSPAAAATPSKTPELNTAGTGFYSNKGRLPWPVANGIITGYFGKQAHPTLKKIQIANNGIDIRTDRNAQVRSVFEGKVVGKQFIPGYEQMLILKHGNYYTVYSNLKEVFVNKNEIVKTKQVIGRASVNTKNNVSEVHFEVWRDKDRLNPLHWIARR